MGVVVMRRALRQRCLRCACGVGLRERAIEMDALVRAVPAGGVAELAADALVFVDVRDDFVVEVEVLPLGDVGERAAAEVVEGVEAFAAHPGEEAVGHVFDDAIAVVHDGGADLHGAGAEEDELGGVLPGGDAADAGDRAARLRGSDMTC